MMKTTQWEEKKQNMPTHLRIRLNRKNIEDNDDEDYYEKIDKAQ